MQWCSWGSLVSEFLHDVVMHLRCGRQRLTLHPRVEGFDRAGHDNPPLADAAELRVCVDEPADVTPQFLLGRYRFRELRECGGVNRPDFARGVEVVVEG